MASPTGQVALNGAEMEQKFSIALDLKDALESVVGLRNKIAHEVSVGVTSKRISDYYRRVQKVVDRIADLCDPV
jgi:uncharacterized protein YutE (UPF0331/DUF86 family)